MPRQQKLRKRLANQIALLVDLLLSVLDEMVELPLSSQLGALGRTLDVRFQLVGIGADRFGVSSRARGLHGLEHRSHEAIQTFDAADGLCAALRELPPSRANRGHGFERARGCANEAIESRQERVGERERFRVGE